MTMLRGCGTALVTPFTAEGRVDEGALRELVDWQVREGIDFLVACGSTGEAATLDPAERARVVSVTVEAARGRVPVVAGATHNDTARVVEEVRRMCDAGADGILSACPYYNKPGPEGLVRHFTAAADASTKPLILYNIPGRTGVNLAPQGAVRLAAHPRIAGIKESSGDLRQIMALLAIRPDDFAVYAGDDWIALAVLALGGDGLVSVVANEVPALTRALVQAGLAGDLPHARALLARLLPLMDANFLESNPAPVKAALHAMGRAGDHVRLPLLPASHATREALRAALHAAGVEGLA